jgi:3-methyladenine DNA glycosylase Tag
MRSFDEIYAMAVANKGGSEAVEQHLDEPKTPDELAAIPDDRWLSRLSQVVFSAGFNWRVVEDKWPGFERSFHRFDIGRCSMLDDEACERAAKSAGIGHARKAFSIRENACLFRDLASEHGSAARFFADWPRDDYVGLLTFLKKRGDRLGGTTTQYFLRTMGVDSFLLSKDVGVALVREGVVDKPPSSQRDLAATQAAFNAWAEQSGRPFNHISRVLALSVG